MNQEPKQVLTTRPVADLRIHPAIQDMPRLPKDDPRYNAMRASWQESGILPPIYITSQDEIVDGRHKYWYAVDTKRLDVPVYLVPDDQVELVVLNGISGQNHTTVGQRAYLAVPYVEPAFQAAMQRRLMVLHPGLRGKLPTIPTADALAERLGISPRLMQQARQIRKAFEKDAKIKAIWEPRILAPEDPIGLGAAIAGMAGKAATEGKARNATRNTPLHNWAISWERLGTAANKGWHNWTDEEKEEATEAITTTVTKLPDIALERTAEAIKAELKSRKSASAVAKN